MLVLLRWSMIVESGGERDWRGTVFAGETI